MKLFSKNEEDYIRSHQTDGIRAIAQALGRTEASVRRKATRLQQPCRHDYEAPTTQPPRHLWTAAEDQYVRQQWPNVIHRKTNAQRVADHLGVSATQTRVRAALLGVARPRVPGPRWSEEEDEYLCEWAHLGLYALAIRFRKRGWERSRSALATRLRHLNQRTRGVNDAIYSARGLADLLGMDNSSVLIWIKKGWLKATPRTPGQHHTSGGPKEWAITPKAARCFIREHTAQVDLTHADKFWLVDLLAGEE